jgi:hypothetical protein
MRAPFLLLVFLCSLISLPNAFAQDRAVWLAATSINGKDCQDFDGPLYRGSRGGYFPLSRIVRNMLGDLTAEHPSWRLTAMSEESSGTLSEKQWALLKEKAAQEIKGLDGCKVGQESMVSTVLSGNILGKKQAKAIPVSSDFWFSQSYSSMSPFQGEPHGEQKGSIIRIDEHIKRAAHVIENEYYVPIVIPAEDITQGWASGLRVIKEVGLSGQLKQISIYKEGSPNSNPPSSRPIAKIVCCPDK